MPRAGSRRSRDRRIDMRGEIVGETADGVLQHIVRRSGGRPPASARRSPSRCGSRSRRPAGTASGYRRRPNSRSVVSTSRAGSKLKATLPCSSCFFLDDRLEQPVLVGEVDIERALGDAGGAGDLAHAGAVEAEIHEDLSRAVENLAALRRILFADESESVGSRCNHWFIFASRFSKAAMAFAGISAYGRAGRNIC